MGDQQSWKHYQSLEVAQYYEFLASQDCPDPASI